MPFAACILGDSEVTLWAVPARERLRRQLVSIGASLIEETTEIASHEQLLLVRADYLFEPRTLKALAERSDTVLLCAQDRGRAAAMIGGAWRARIQPALLDHALPLPEHLRVIEPSDLHAFDVNLRRAEQPLLEPLTKSRLGPLEDQLYGNSYKGITDLVTKWLWPRPAKRVVRWCANRGVTPNTVTATGFVLMLLAAVLFYNGAYWSGLAAGWLMTLLDTVDGKLARVTVKSSRFGHYFDHGIDLLHPPFWYIYWGMSLPGLQLADTFSGWQIYWTIIVGYVAGRAVEGVFHAFGNCSIFTWRPFDAWFRLVTARRNPCLIIMTLAMLMQRPDWGLIGIVVWTWATTLVLCLRLLQGGIARVVAGRRLDSWLAEPGAGHRFPRSYRTFSSTAGAYTPG